MAYFIIKHSATDDDGYWYLAGVYTSKEVAQAISKEFIENYTENDGTMREEIIELYDGMILAVVEEMPNGERYVHGLYTTIDKALKRYSVEAPIDDTTYYEHNSTHSRFYIIPQILNEDFETVCTYYWYIFIKLNKRKVRSVKPDLLLIRVVKYL